MTKNFILVGNSNVGKTTLFNSLAGMDEHVGNWAGVTVGIRQAKTKDFLVTDLPGIYSLNCFSMEEQVAKDFLMSHKHDIIVNVAECKNLSRNLFLTLQMIELGIKPILLVNMVDDVKNKGGRFDAKALSQILGIQVYEVDARDKNFCTQVFSKIGVQDPVALPYDKEAKNVTQLRYQYIDSFIDKVLRYDQVMTKVQKVLFNKWISLALFGLLVGCAFWLTFAKNGIGGLLVSFIDGLLVMAKKEIYSLLSANCPTWLTSFVLDVVIEGIGVVAKFLPQVLMLFFFLNMLEDTGYISRIAFMFDGIMSKVGLNGKSIFTLLLGFGCNTTAVATSNNLGNKQVQKRTLLVSPFIPCSAKMPVFVTILALASPILMGYEIFVITGLYLLCIFVSFFVASLLNLFGKESVQNDFVLEISPLRMPSVKRVAKSVYKNTKSFVARLVGILFLCVAVIWLLKSFSWDFVFLTEADIEKSILSSIGKRFVFLFAPIGITDWRICVSLILGITAKEVVAGTLILLYGSSFGGVLSWQAVVVFLIFVSLYVPCVSTVAMVKKECGAKTALLSVVINTLTAYLICFVFFNFSLAFERSAVFGFVLIGAVVFVAISLHFVLKYNDKCKNCKRCTLEDAKLQNK